MEQRQGGEQFRLLDAASFPRKPEKGRLKVVVMGWALGLGAGLALALLREMTNQTVHSKAELAAFGVPVLVPIPSLRTAQEEKRDARALRMEIAAAACALLVACGTGIHTVLRG